ncbi:unnamed protein product [Ixodes hexagonus]
MAATDRPGDCGHTVFTNDPILFRSYVQKLVRVETVNGKVHAGYVKTVDPVVVLVLFEDAKPRTVNVIMGHAIRSITVVEDASPEERQQIEQLFIPPREKLSPQQLKTKKENLRSWLQIGRVPVKECADDPDVLMISNAVRLVPPYGPEDCYCTNPVVLGKVRGLICSMPADVQSWTSPYQPVN